MDVELIARLEQMIDRLLSERGQLLRRNRDLAGECERLRAERLRIGGELDGVLARIDSLEEGGR